MSKDGLRLIVRLRRLGICKWENISQSFRLGNKVTKQIDKAADKVEEVATGEGPKWMDKVNFNFLHTWSVSELFVLPEHYSSLPYSQWFLWHQQHCFRSNKYVKTMPQQLLDLRVGFF